MEDEFIEDDFLEEEESGASNRPFLTAVGILVTVFILAALCTLAFVMMDRGSATNSAEVAAIETQNAITIVTNTAVAQFIAQTETAQAGPTSTPASAATNTSTPAAATASPAVTNTRVLDAAVEEGDGGREGENGEEAVGEGTAVAVSTEGAPGTIVIGEEGADSGSEGGAESGAGSGAGSGSESGAESGTGSGDSGAASGGTVVSTGTGTGGVVTGKTPTPATTTGTQTGTLPQTGLETWAIALVGLFLVGVLVVAHRLRAR